VAEPDPAGMFTAVQAALQALGPKLDLARAPREILVIDGVRRTREDQPHVPFALLQNANVHAAAENGGRSYRIIAGAPNPR
jgi:hypothetical protein